MQTRALLALALCAAACNTQTKTPTAGKVRVSGSCGVETGSTNDDGRAEGYGYAYDIDHTSATLTIDDGKLARLAVEVQDYVTTAHVVGMDDMVEGHVPTEVASTAVTYRAEASPGTQLVVGDWVSVPVTLRRVELSKAFEVPLDGGTGLLESLDPMEVKVRILGDDVEVVIGRVPSAKGPCAWGKSSE